MSSGSVEATISTIADIVTEGGIAPSLARQRAEAEGVSERVRFELLDYRAVEGQFDRIVSVGMFEHVGLPHFNQFFQTVEALRPLGPGFVSVTDGAGGLDTMTITLVAASAASTSMPCSMVVPPMAS